MPEDVILIVCASVCGLSLLGVWLLRSPETRLSRLLDRIDPGNES